MPTSAGGRAREAHDRLAQRDADLARLRQRPGEVRDPVVGEVAHGLRRARPSAAAAARVEGLAEALEGHPRARLRDQLVELVQRLAQAPVDRRRLAQHGSAGLERLVEHRQGAAQVLGARAASGARTARRSQEDALVGQEADPGLVASAAPRRSRP